MFDWVITTTKTIYLFIHFMYQINHIVHSFSLLFIFISKLAIGVFYFIYKKKLSISLTQTTPYRDNIIAENPLNELKRAKKISSIWKIAKVHIYNIN